MDADMAQQQEKEHRDRAVDFDMATKQQHGDIAVDSDVPPSPSSFSTMTSPSSRRRSTATSPWTPTWSPRCSSMATSPP